MRGTMTGLWAVMVLLFATVALAALPPISHFLPKGSPHLAFLRARARAYGYLHRGHVRVRHLNIFLNVSLHAMHTF